jgi:hypothetical protein
MSGGSGASELTAEQVRELCELLAAEERQYRRLLRLAWRQHRYMKRHDTTRLVENTHQWQKYLPTADAARREREGCVARVAANLGIFPAPASPMQLLNEVDFDATLEVRTRVRSLLATTARLARQNALNQELATFCLELTHEEAEIFKRCVLDDPAGCYDSAARPAQSGPGGVLERQA